MTVSDTTYSRCLIRHGAPQMRLLLCTTIRLLMYSNIVKATMTRLLGASNLKKTEHILNKDFDNDFNWIFSVQVYLSQAEFWSASESFINHTTLFSVPQINRIFTLSCPGAYVSIWRIGAHRECLPLIPNLNNMHHIAIPKVL
jgi:hypothetical protein